LLTVLQNNNILTKIANNITIMPDNSIQTAIIIPEKVWNDITKRLEMLESKKVEETQKDPINIFHSARETWELLRIHEVSLSRARNNGHIRGIKKDGREYIYSLSEINRYRKGKPRYKRELEEMI
jgi:hypothetical protein